MLDIDSTDIAAMSRANNNLQRKCFGTYSKRAVMIAMRIRTFIPPYDLDEMSFDKENLIVRFGL